MKSNLSKYILYNIEEMNSLMMNLKILSKVLINNLSTELLILYYLLNKY